MIRVACYVDGFNLYHAIDAVCIHRDAMDYLKWVNLWRLAEQFTDPHVHEMVAVTYFSAHMSWHPQRELRQKEYVKALCWAGVKPVMGRFKEKHAYCKICNATYKVREEKQSDVNIATHLVSDAYEDRFDQAFLITNDSDLVGPVRFLRGRFPQKGLKLIAPPMRHHSKELWALATHRAAIKEGHLKVCLFPAQVLDRDGAPIFQRPREYDPPG